MTDPITPIVGASNRENRARVAVVAESSEGFELLSHTVEMLGRFGLPAVRIEADDRAGLPAAVSTAESAGVRVFVVACLTRNSLAKGVAKATGRVVLAVPGASLGMTAMESLEEAVSGSNADSPVGSLAIGKAGATNAALMAVAILATTDSELALRLDEFRAHQTATVLAHPIPGR